MRHTIQSTQEKYLQTCARLRYNSGTGRGPDQTTLERIEIMTIETATPSSAETIAALFDHLVEAVAQRVMAKLQEGEALDNAMDAWAMNSTVLEDKIDDRVQTYVDTQLDLDDAVRQALENVDLDDMVMSAVQELEFSVRVSR